MSRAFLATLRDEPACSSPFLLSAGSTVLVVDDLAPAIARVEEDLRSSRLRACRPSDVDAFDALVTTDDCSGPALYRPYIPTPVPPPCTSSSAEAAPILILDRDAFFHPAGQIPGFADLSGREPERRISLVWVAAAFLAPLAIAALVLVALTAAGLWSGASVTGLASAPLHPSEQAISPPEPLTAPAASPSAAGPAAAARSDAPSLLVLDVNSLKSAPRAVAAKPRRPHP